MKSIEDYHRCTKSTTGRNGKCKCCYSEQRKKRYPLWKNNVIAKTKANRILLAKAVDELKRNVPCADCLKEYEPSCMEYDHLSDKILAVSKMVHENYSLESIKKEIAKCELVCVLCHKARTYDRLMIKFNKPEKSPAYVRNKQFLFEAKSKPCQICNMTYRPCQMEFDHIDRENKSSCVGTVSGTGCSIERIKEEIEKCQLLCALCHRRKTKTECWDKGQARWLTLDNQLSTDLPGK